MGIILGLGACLSILTVYSLCVVAGEADRAMEQDLIQMKKDRERERSERDH